MRTMIYFNPLHREGGDPGASILHQLFDYFNPLHREGGDQVYPDVSFLYSEFQSTPPRGWRQFLPAVFPHTYNFNPLHREGGDLRYRYWGGPEKISIHSTARVETVKLKAIAPYGGISIHSTARVETSRLSLVDVSEVYFNPLHREGGDTVLSTKRCLAGLNFNPLHREGGDPSSSSFGSQSSRFQSTPPRGWRRVIQSLYQHCHAISIHSTARVETVISSHIVITKISFQSTPPRGWRLHSHSTYKCCYADFNPLHREGGDGKLSGTSLTAL